MSLAFAMVLLASLAPYITVALAKGGTQAAYDNDAPRDWATRQDGWRARALAAHQNHFEAFAPFAAGVIAATLAGARQGWIDALAVAFVVLRVLYTIVYVQGAASLRTVVWGLGFICVLGLFGLAIW